MRIMEEDGIEAGEGDLVCSHTGFARGLPDMGRSPDEHRLHTTFACLDGRCAWIRDSGVAVVIGDNHGIEDTSVPPPPGDAPLAMPPLHELCIFKLGIHIGEMFYLTGLRDRLAEPGRYRFLLTAPPLRLPWEVGSPPAPIATL